MECELLIFSSVRSNLSGAIGFLKDHRRVNVMMTRARRGLIVLGNEATLISDPLWCRWLNWIHFHKAIVHGSTGGDRLPNSVAGGGGACDTRVNEASRRKRSRSRSRDRFVHVYR